MDPLSQLKDIHLPPPVTGWPLGIIGNFILGLFLIGLLYLGWRIFTRWESVKARRYTLNRLEQLKKEYAHEEDAVAIAIELSQLLRRVALAVFPRKEVAGLKSDAWLAFLDRTGKTYAFTQGPGRALISAPYQSRTKYKVDELFKLSTAWVKHNLPGLWGKKC